MKKCPLCAEDVQDEAIRCKHCGGDIKARAETLATNQSKSRAAKTGAAIASVVGAVFGYSATASVAASGLKILGGTLLGAVLVPIGWRLGWAFGVLCQPSVIFDSDAVRAGVRRVGYSFLPLIFAVIGTFAAMYGVTAAFRDEQVKAVNSPSAGKSSPSMDPSSTPEKVTAKKKNKKSFAVEDSENRPSGAGAHAPSSSESSQSDSGVSTSITQMKETFVPNLGNYYPEGSRRAGEEGRATVRICVAASGAIDSADLATSSGHPLLDDAALNFARAIRFAPATSDGKPVRSCATLPLNFALQATGAD